MVLGVTQIYVEPIDGRIPDKKQWHKNDQKIINNVFANCSEIKYSTGKHNINTSRINCQKLFSDEFLKCYVTKWYCISSFQLFYTKGFKLTTQCPSHMISIALHAPTY
jgi:hypothetical protein